MARVAVIMTSHNRRETTLHSVRAVLDQTGADVHVFLTDDGSTDGTAQALQPMADQVTVIPGDGTLYWAAGMAVAERQAIRTEPDFLLWLNDDTLIDPGGLAQLLSVADARPGAIVVGNTRDPRASGVTYGGRVRLSRWHPQRLQLLGESSEIADVDTFNGNVVLIPWGARVAVGPIDDRFPHAYADDDYGLRAGRVGIRVVQAPGTVGTCARNVPALEPVRGWRGRQHAKGLPWRAQARYLRRHAGPIWPLVFVGQQARWVLGRR